MLNMKQTYPGIQYSWEKSTQKIWSHNQFGGGAFEGKLFKITNFHSLRTITCLIFQSRKKQPWNIAYFLMYNTKKLLQEWPGGLLLRRLWILRSHFFPTKIPRAGGKGSWGVENVETVRKIQNLRKKAGKCDNAWGKAANTPFSPPLSFFCKALQGLT